MLHGGPGLPHDYLLDLAEIDRPVVRTSPLPEHVMRAVTRLGREVYETMYGTEWNRPET